MQFDLPEVDFASKDEREFEKQVKSWRNTLDEDALEKFNPETSRFFSSSALSESRRIRLERKRLERESKAKPKGSK